MGTILGINVENFTRQNKKQQESTKKANARKFYFSTDEWLIFEEIEDVEERGKAILRLFTKFHS